MRQSNGAVDIDARLAAGTPPGKLRVSAEHPLHDVPRTRKRARSSGGADYTVTLGRRPHDWCSIWGHRHSGLYKLTAFVQAGRLRDWCIEHEAVHDPDRFYCHRRHYLYGERPGDIWPPAMSTWSPKHRGPVLMGFPDLADSPDAHLHADLTPRGRATRHCAPISAGDEAAGKALEAPIALIPAA